MFELIGKVPGLGPATAEALHRAGFCNASDIETASDKVLMAVPRVGEAMVARIRAYYMDPEAYRRMLASGHLQDNFKQSFDQLSGMVQGMYADGKVVQAEAEFLQQWLADNRDCADKWPASVIEVRLEEMLADGHLDSDESEELLGMLHALAGESANWSAFPKPEEVGVFIDAEGEPDPYVDIIGDETDPGDPSSRLVLDNPKPPVIFPGRTFVFTGKFISCPRAVCQNVTVELGGYYRSSVSKSNCKHDDITNYLNSKL